MGWSRESWRMTHSPKVSPQKQLTKWEMPPQLARKEWKVRASSNHWKEIEFCVREEMNTFWKASLGTLASCHQRRLEKTTAWDVLDYLLSQWHQPSFPVIGTEACTAWRQHRSHHLCTQWVYSWGRWGTCSPSWHLGPGCCPGDNKSISFSEYF